MLRCLNNECETISFSDFEEVSVSADPVPLEAITPERVAAVMRVYLEKHNMDASLADRLEELSLIHI